MHSMDIPPQTASQFQRRSKEGGSNASDGFYHEVPAETNNSNKHTTEHVITKVHASLGWCQPTPAQSGIIQLHANAILDPENPKS